MAAGGLPGSSDRRRRRLRWSRRDGCLLFLACLVCLAAWSPPGHAGDHPWLYIPLRVPNIVAGDWIVFAEGERLVRHRAVRIEETVEDRVVQYTVEVLDGDGGVLSTQERTYSREEEAAAAEELRRQYGRLGIVGERRQVEVGGRLLQVVVYSLPEPINAEIWLSDEASILGSIRLWHHGDGEEQGYGVEPIAFGGAGDG
ncbi:MAG: hypothetical protein LIP77_08535 [Planctomycetes bacterium]|nr:hypothetical protein [Planctomycetota bacterium]